MIAAEVLARQRQQGKRPSRLESSTRRCMHCLVPVAPWTKTQCCSRCRGKRWVVVRRGYYSHGGGI